MNTMQSFHCYDKNLDKYAMKQSFGDHVGFQLANTKKDLFQILVYYS